MAEPRARPDAAAGMSGQFRPAASPRLAIPRSVSVAPAATGPGGEVEAAFEAWLRRELTRLYGAALAEPVPEELSRLLDPRPADANGTTPDATQG